MKICSVCKATETTKWFSGPLCRICYRNQPHIKSQEKLTRLKKVAHYNSIAKEYSVNNKEAIKVKNKIWYEKNKDQVAIKKKQYKVDNKDSVYTYENNYSKNRKLKDVDYKIKCNLRSRLSHAIKGNFKTGSAVSDLGCTIEELKKYLESQFQDSMSWDNYGRKGWHIDHIEPLCSFDLTNEEELNKACHYTNLQPLWAIDNLKKGSKLPDEAETLCH